MMVYTPGTGIIISGLENIKATLSEAAQNAFPSAMARAVVETAKQVQTAEIEEMKRVFDRPTPWTLNSVARQSFMPEGGNIKAAEVYLKDDYSVGKSGTPATKFLYPEIFGGDRNLKRHEKALQYAGVLPAGMYCVPGKGADMDAYGNMKASQIIQIISYFKGFREGGYRANITDQRKAKLKAGTKKQRGYEYVVFQGAGKSGMYHHPGIYKRMNSNSWGGALKPLIMFVRKPSYRERFRFYEVGNAVAENLERNLALELEAALAKLR